MKQDFGQNQPNILWIGVDQMRADSLSSPICQTPNIDRLAKESVNFSRAYLPSSLCTPTRASMFTGLYAFNQRKDVLFFLPVSSGVPMARISHHPNMPDVITMLRFSHGSITRILTKESLTDLRALPKAFSKSGMEPYQNLYFLSEMKTFS